MVHYIPRRFRHPAEAGYPDAEIDVHELTPTLEAMYVERLRRANNTGYCWLLLLTTTEMLKCANPIICLPGHILLSVFVALFGPFKEKYENLKLLPNKAFRLLHVTQCEGSVIKGSELEQYRRWGYTIGGVQKVAYETDTVVTSAGSSLTKVLNVVKLFNFKLMQIFNHLKTVRPVYIITGMAAASACYSVLTPYQLNFLIWLVLIAFLFCKTPDKLRPPVIASASIIPVHLTLVMLGIFFVVHTTIDGLDGTIETVVTQIHDGDRGYCYLKLFDDDVRSEKARYYGAWPKITDVMKDKQLVKDLDNYCITKFDKSLCHIERGTSTEFVLGKFEDYKSLFKDVRVGGDYTELFSGFAISITTAFLNLYGKVESVTTPIDDIKTQVFRKWLTGELGISAIEGDNLRLVYGYLGVTCMVSIVVSLTVMFFILIIDAIRGVTRSKRNLNQLDGVISTLDKLTYKYTLSFVVGTAVLAVLMGSSNFRVKLGNDMIKIASSETNVARIVIESFGKSYKDVVLVISTLFAVVIAILVVRIDFTALLHYSFTAIVPVSVVIGLMLYLKKVPTAAIASVLNSAETETDSLVHRLLVNAEVSKRVSLPNFVMRPLELSFGVLLVLRVFVFEKFFMLLGKAIDHVTIPGALKFYTIGIITALSSFAVVLKIALVSSSPSSLISMLPVALALLGYNICRIFGLSPIVPLSTVETTVGESMAAQASGTSVLLTFSRFLDVLSNASEAVNAGVIHLITGVKFEYVQRAVMTEPTQRARYHSVTQNGALTGFIRRLATVTPTYIRQFGCSLHALSAVKVESKRTFEYCMDLEVTDAFGINDAWATVRENTIDLFIAHVDSDYLTANELFLLSVNYSLTKNMLDIRTQVPVDSMERNLEVGTILVIPPDRNDMGDMVLFNGGDRELGIKGYYTEFSNSVVFPVFSNEPFYYTEVNPKADFIPIRKRAYDKLRQTIPIDILFSDMMPVATLFVYGAEEFCQGIVDIQTKTVLPITLSNDIEEAKNTYGVRVIDYCNPLYEQYTVRLGGWIGPPNDGATFLTISDVE